METIPLKLEIEINATCSECGTTLETVSIDLLRQRDLIFSIDIKPCGDCLDAATDLGAQNLGQ